MTVHEETNPPATSGEPVPPVRGWAGVAAITASLFVFLTTELMPIGLLTPIGESLGVSVGAATGRRTTARPS
ncbi:hypothetical protein [Streptomyces sp. McG3]|uniref:hypothetical protein n=1 Tax=Streptomyces sp. McG3 TaxID=2725483 RepID=UPI0020366AB2|nr:hypothetical protein [Streptomyces sp. McG3]